MKYLSALRDLLRAPFATANREALGFALLFYGGIAMALGLVALGLWLLVG